VGKKKLEDKKYPISIYVERTRGKQKGEKYLRGFKTEEERDKCLRRYEIRNAEKNILPKEKNPKYHEMSVKSAITRVKNETRSMIYRVNKHGDRTEIFDEIKKSISPRKLRIMATELEMGGFHPESIMAEGKADELEKHKEKSEVIKDLTRDLDEDSVQAQLFKNIMKLDKAKTNVV